MFCFLGVFVVVLVLWWVEFLLVDDYYVWRMVVEKDVEDFIIMFFDF